MNYLHFKKKRILVFGDSNTFGYDVENDSRFDDDTRYPCVLQRLLGDNYTIIEEGLPGRTAVFDDPINQGLRGLDYIIPCMSSHEPIDNVVIMLGTNDCKERFACNSTLIAAGIIRLAKMALTSTAWRDKPNVLIVCPATIKPAYLTGVFYTAMGDKCDVRSAGLSLELKAACEAAKIDFLDANTIKGVENATLDSMHLTANAHLCLANELYNILK